MGRAIHYSAKKLQSDDRGLFIQIKKRIYRPDPDELRDCPCMRGAGAFCDRLRLPKIDDPYLEGDFVPLVIGTDVIFCHRDGNGRTPGDIINVQRVLTRAAFIRVFQPRDPAEANQEWAILETWADERLPLKSEKSPKSR